MESITSTSLLCSSRHDSFTLINSRLFNVKSNTCKEEEVMFVSI